LLRRARDNGPRRRRTDDRALFVRYRACRDPELREALVERYLPLARSVARRFRHPTESPDDILQVACLSLLKAIDRFDPEMGVEFSSYAVPSIEGAIKRHYRDHTWTIRVPRDLKELALRVERVADDLCLSLRRHPTAAEVARRLDVSVADVLAARQAATAYHPDSLHAARGGGSADTPGQLLGDRDPGFARTDDREALRHLMRHLTSRERIVLTLRFEHGLTQSEIATCLGVSQMTVSRVLRQVLERLRQLALQERDGVTGDRRLSA
jgi:RNA polymerase sigma-B factor